MSIFRSYSARTASLNKKKTNFLTLAKKSAKLADDKKGEDILILNVKKISGFAEYLLIVTAGSLPQINAISESIKKGLSENSGLLPLHREGRRSESWAALDYGGLVIHIMSYQTRQFYRLEKLWDKARHIAFSKC